MGTVLCSALMTLAGFLVSDLLYALVDPRVRL
jgi:ABC-type dipeptide/oligopeptide/nickel transport system permease component